MSKRTPRPRGEATSDMLPFASEHSLAPTKIVGLFESTFHHILEAPDLQDHIQIVKGELFKRDYLSAFDSDDKRFAYASRWSPARALAYSSLFASLPEVVALLGDPDHQSRVLCVGGGASAEVVALGAVYGQLKGQQPSSASKLHVDIVDIADWTSVVSNLTHFIQKNWYYDGSNFQTNFLNADILAADAQKMQLLSLDLVTLLFTTNELFCEKRKETVNFLHTLNKNCQKGSYLLIAESAGSYSHITVGTKKFPVQFLIDTILVGKPGAEDGAWETVQLSESCWYRVDTRKVEYQMKLENMRFFYRLYRKK